MGRLAWSCKFENPKESYSLANTEISLGKKTNDQFLIMDAYRTLGFYHIVSKKYIEGFQYYDQSIQIATKFKNYFYLATVNSLIAGAYYDQSEYNTSISYYLKGLDAAIISKNENVIAMLRLNLAAVYMTANTSIDKAKPLLRDAIGSYLELKIWSSAALVASNLAELYSREQSQDTAFKYLKLSENLLQRDSNIPFMNGQVQMGIAGTYLNLKRYKEAETIALNAIQIFKSLNLSTNLLPGYEVLTKCEIEKGDFQEAKKYALLLLKTAEENKSKIAICQSYELLSKIEKKKGNFKQSLDFHEQYTLWNDSLNEERKLERASQMEFKIQTQQKLQENKYLVAQNKKLRQDVLYMSIIAVCFALLFGGVAYLFKTKNKLNQALFAEKKIVEQQVEDKSILLQEVNHRVKNNLTMIKSLLYLQSKNVKTKEAKNVLEDFQNRIQSIAIVHTKLYETEYIGTLDITNLIQSIYSELKMSFGDGSIKFRITGSCSALDITTAITLGLIFNELITNSIKHAFKKIDEGRIDIHIKEMSDYITIQYFDNGPGLKDKFDESLGNFGFKLLHLLPKQINGNLLYLYDEFSCHYELKFKNPKS